MHAPVHRWARTGRRALNAALCGLALAAGHGSAGAYALTVSPFAQTASLGSEVGVALTVADVLPGGLGGYNFDISFDAGILSFGRIVDAQGLGLAFGLVSVAGAGLLSVADASLESESDLLALQSESFTLFTVYFDAVGLGTSALSLDAVAFADAAGNAVSPSAVGGSVTVLPNNAVPVPGTLSLVLVAALAGQFRRRRADPGSA
jgi:uncharacterized protein (TIGR03382 family)